METDIKNELIQYLKNRPINDDIVTLWSECKHWCKQRSIEMGGSYASFGNHVSVITKTDRFKIYLKDVC